MERQGSEAVGDGGGWTEVVRRRSIKGKAAADQGLITFFFRNFPESCSEEDLRRRFEKIGKVADIFIPGKRDKVGKRFGFVRFRKGEGEDRLLVRLNNTGLAPSSFGLSFPDSVALRLRGRALLKGISVPSPPLGISDPSNTLSSSGMAHYLRSSGPVRSPLLWWELSLETLYLFPSRPAMMKRNG